MDVIIRPACFPQDSNVVLDIWREFVASPDANLDFQGYETEFANIPGKYAAPEGCILLGVEGRHIVGCVASRKINASICEMKRLYVRPKARGLGVGKMLVERLISEACTAGYEEMRLDVLAEFHIAQKLYKDIGFIDAEPVSFNPLPGTQFLGLNLRQATNSGTRSQSSVP